MAKKYKKVSSFWEPTSQRARLKSQQSPIYLEQNWRTKQRIVNSPWLGGFMVTGIIALFFIAVIFSAIIKFQQQKLHPVSYYGNYNVYSAQENIVPQKRERILRPVNLDLKSFTRRNFAQISNSNINHKQIIPQPFQLLTLNLSATTRNKHSYPAYDLDRIFRNANSGANNKKDTLPKNKAKGTIDHNINITISSINSPLISQAITHGFSLDEIINAVTTPMAEDLEKASSNEKSIQVRITPENVSHASIPDSATLTTYQIADNFIYLNQAQSLSSFFKKLKVNITSKEINQLELLIKNHLKYSMIPSKHIVNLTLETFGDKQQLSRFSIYQDTKNLVTFALNDKKEFVVAPAPKMTELLINNLKEAKVNSAHLDMKPKKLRLYDAIYQSGLASGLSVTSITPIIEALAKRVDLKRIVTEGETLQLFYQLPEHMIKTQEAGFETEPLDTNILYFSAQFAQETLTYYSYRFDSSKVEYYDDHNKAIGLSILRQPVENSYLSSPFGMRRHPVLGYVRLHTGVDWAAPRGTPVVAAGDGTVIRIAPLLSGYGNHLVIRHDNGYTTSYSHLSKFAEDMKVGKKVKQRQVIGYIGSTGMSTGPHLHFEILVDGKRTDPLRVPVPDDNPLTGTDLLKFKQEKDIIQQILKN